MENKNLNQEHETNYNTRNTTVKQTSRTNQTHILLQSKKVTSLKH